MEQEKQAVMQVFETMQQAMIDKDLDTMRRITAEDKTFTHMSGKTQTREEFFERHFELLQLRDQESADHDQ